MTRNNRGRGRAGFDSTPDIYMPLIEKEAKDVRGKSVKPVVPLLSGYLFSRANRLRDVARGGHVLGVLGNGEVPAVVPQSIIDELQRREDKDGIIRLPKRRRRFRAGKLVRASGSSPLSGLEAIVTGTNGSGRVTALFQMFRQSTPVTLSKAELTEIN